MWCLTHWCDARRIDGLHMEFPGNVGWSSHMSILKHRLWGQFVNQRLENHSRMKKTDKLAGKVYASSQGLKEKSTVQEIRIGA